MVPRFRRTPPRSRLFSFISSIAPAWFWLVVACKISCGGRLWPRRVLFLLFFCRYFNGPNNRIRSHPTFIAQLTVAFTSNPLLPPTFGLLLCLSISSQPSKVKGSPISLILFFSTQFDGPNDGITSHPTQIAQLTVNPKSYPLLLPTFGWLLSLPTEWRPPKAEAPPLSLFLNGLRFGTPSKATSRGNRKTATGRLHRTHGELRHYDLGPWRMLPCSERTTRSCLREGSGGTSCCVFCVVTRVMFVCVVSIYLADCRVECPKQGKYSPQQKLGTNGPPKMPSTAESSYG